MGTPSVLEAANSSDSSKIAALASDDLQKGQAQKRQQRQQGKLSPTREDRHQKVYRQCMHIATQMFQRIRPKRATSWQGWCAVTVRYQKVPQ